jgi:hypothetical protein
VSTDGRVVRKTRATMRQHGSCLISRPKSRFQSASRAPAHNLVPIERQILPTPLLYLSAFFEASRRDYYEGLRGISERGAWLGANQISDNAPMKSGLGTSDMCSRFPP